MPHLLMPEEILPEAIENIFRSSLIHVAEHKPFSEQEKRKVFVCHDNNLKIGVYVCPDSKLIVFRSAIERKATAKDQLLLCADMFNDMMKCLPMIRVIVSDDVVNFEYFLCGTNGISPEVIIGSFRYFSNILKDALGKVRCIMDSCCVIDLTSKERPKPPGKDYDVSDIDKLFEQILSDPLPPEME